MIIRDTKLYIRHYGKLTLDILAFATAILLANVIAGNTPALVGGSLLKWVPLLVLLRTIVHLVLKLHKTIWRYSSTDDLTRIIESSTIGSIGIILLDLAIPAFALPRLVIFIDWILAIFLNGGQRLLVRRVFEIFFQRTTVHAKHNPVLIYGAGRAGELLARNILNSKNSGIDIIGFIDDDPLKQGRRIHNKSVLGDGTTIRQIIRENGITEVYFAISSLTGVDTRRLLALIRNQIPSDVKIKTIPGLRDIVDGQVSINQLREFDIRDLLRRNQVTLNERPVLDMLGGKRVLVVGAGGSIGSELCRQIAQKNPAELIIMDHSEFNLYTIEADLQHHYPNIHLTSIVLDACKEKLVERVFSLYKPEHVFHAAAYKHVPLMEYNPWSAIVNNLQSTLILTDMAEKYGVERFVLISSDKAVQPTNVMGATKRICELITLSHSKNGKTHYMAVRFGNVLGSSGSVIPKFREQIAEGGPITVTHPDITRYFMLIPEAVELVLQAGAIGENGNIYVLDMGEPVRIDDLARLMVELSGLKVGDDIQIQYVGLRPGEKLFESLHLEGEECNTDIPGLMVLNPHINENGKFIAKVKRLINNNVNLDHHEIREEIKVLVPEYTPQDLPETKTKSKTNGKLKPVRRKQIA